MSLFWADHPRKIWSKNGNQKESYKTFYFDVRNPNRELILTLLVLCITTWNNLTHINKTLQSEVFCMWWTLEIRCADIYRIPSGIFCNFYPSQNRFHCPILWIIINTYLKVWNIKWKYETLLARVKIDPDFLKNGPLHAVIRWIKSFVKAFDEFTHKDIHFSDLLMLTAIVVMQQTNIKLNEVLEILLDNMTLDFNYFSNFKHQTSLQLAHPYSFPHSPQSGNEREEVWTSIKSHWIPFLFKYQNSKLSDKQFNNSSNNSQSQDYVMFWCIRPSKMSEFKITRYLAYRQYSLSWLQRKCHDRALFVKV